jgi:glycosyltransferase involved in cell wall biosynthesis
MMKERLMNVVVTTEEHFDRTPDYRVWTSGPFSYPFWTRYLAVFDSVRILARVRNVPVPPPGFRLVSGPNVTFAGVPDYLGPEQYLLRMASIAAATAKAVQNGDAVILRVPGRMGICVESRLRKMRRPYAVEVVGDPYDVFAPGAVRHPLRPLFRWLFDSNLRRQCAAACAAAYVTEYALQRRYPPGSEAFATHCSDVELPPAAFVDVPRTSMPNGAARLIFVGSLAQLYKAPDVLIDAVGDCVRNGLDIGLVLVGSGRYQAQVEARVLALGLGNRVQFRGHLTTPEAVRTELDQAHLFVLPSRVEGLPRAMIEAMARSLPCLGSTIGGIPELIPEEDLVPPGDAPALARKIHEVITDPVRMARMSARNLAKAQEYSDTILTGRRKNFYHHLRACNEAWLEGKK